jgi:hypothetical protein
MNLLRPFTGTGALFFPVGPPPDGTCQYATEACLKHCYVNDRSDFDEELLVSKWDKKRIYQRVMEWDLQKLVALILSDLCGLQTRILHWFGTGDCLDKDVDRVSEVIEAVPADVIQMGFTRNRKLWGRHKDILALTLEKFDPAPDPAAMYSVPDYENETSVMWCPSYDVRGGFCGPILCKDSDRHYADLTHYINCRTCYRRKLGCFDRRPVE